MWARRAASAGQGEGVGRHQCAAATGARGLAGARRAGGGRRRRHARGGRRAETEGPGACARRAPA
eukprot:2517520-Prymnesium_polylepis.1